LKDNIKTDIKKIWRESEAWIKVAPGQNRLTGSCEHVNVPSGFIRAENFITSQATASLTRRFLRHELGVQ
jgi:hypothetical protein